MAQKTHTTAVVIIPPVEVWEPIQMIRRVHDRHIKRWMPHITLLYPFRPHHQFTELAERFSTRCTDLAPFRIELRETRFFQHRGESYTLWLAAEPSSALIGLQALLASVVPDCDDVTRMRQGFTPHLSVGQVRGANQMAMLRETIQSTWKPIAFTAAEVSLIWRREPPDDVFRVGQRVSLGVETPQAPG
jgi:2'-5' RNA ligase